MISGEVIIFNDYGFPEYKFAKKQAVDEFFATRPERPISLPTGQCIIIKLWPYASKVYRLTHITT